MAPSALSLVGLTFALLALAILFSFHARRAARVDGASALPWWCASEGNGSPGGPSRHRAADDPPIAAIWAFRPAIIRWVLKRGVPEREAEDLAQTIIENAWRSRRHWDPALCSLHCWLYVITRNHVHTYHARADVRNETFVEDPREELAPDDLEAAAGMRQGGERALAILERIPDHLAAVWTMYTIEDEPMAAIAAELGIPLSTAWGWREQARAMLKREVARIDAIEAHWRARRMRR